MKRTITLLLALVIVVGIISYVPVTAQAAEVNSGKCGENLTWTLDGDGVLTISGSGDMYDFDYNSVPWQNHKSNIYEVDIEEGVTSIGAYAFYDCFSLCNLKIANTVVRIGKSAFDCCTGLSSVVIPNSVVTIGDYAFRMCERMEEAVIGSGVKCIGDGAFAYCWNLSKITFRGDAPGFIYYAFSGVTATAYYPVGNRTWTSSAMMSDANITWVPYATENIAAYGTCGDNLTWTLDNDGTLTISGTGAMYSYGANGAPWFGKNVRRIILEEGVTSVSSYAFGATYGSVYLVVIPSTLTSIGIEAFMCGARCVVINSETIAMGATSYDALGYLLFQSKSVMIKEGFSHGGYVTNGRSYTYGGEFQGESYTIFSKCHVHTYKQTNVLSEDMLCCNECNAIIDFSVIEFDVSATDNDSVTAKLYKSGDDVVLQFSGFGAIRSSEKEWHAFLYLVTRVEIGEGVTYIPDDAFYYFTSLKSVTISDTVTEIGVWAFDYCISLTDITFEGDAPAISSNAFGSVVATAYYPANNATWTSNILQNYGGTITWVPYATETIIASGTCGENLTWKLDENGLLTISGEGKMDSYSSDSNTAPWNDYRDEIKHVIIQDGVTSIGKWAFYYCTSMISIELPSSLASINSAAFWSCSSLTSIDVPAGVTSIASYAFHGCSSLTAVKIPDSVTRIDYNAFEKCTALTSIDIPASVTYIGTSAFAYCNSLTEVKVDSGNKHYMDVDGVLFDKNQTTLICYPAGKSETHYTIPDSVAHIGTGAFKDCTSLTSVELPDGLTSIGVTAFAFCNRLTAIDIPAGVTSIGGFAFVDCSSLTSIDIPASVTSIGESTFENCSRLTAITFEGDAPVINEKAFSRVTATVSYPAGNDTWTEDIMQNYGGTLTWVTYGNPSPVITQQPTNAYAALGDNYCVTVEVEGEGLKYQWYFRNAGSDVWYKSSVRDNTYDDVMTKARAGREVYCVITDAYGNKVTTDIVKLIRVAKEELQIVTQPVSDEAVLGETYSVTVVAKGEGLKYQWYFRNEGSLIWYKSSVRTDTYTNVMTKVRAGREIYCVITDALGNTVTTDIVKLIRVPKEELQIITQPTNAQAALGDDYCVTVVAQGEDLKYQWYFRNAGSDTWYKSSVRDNTYDDMMTNARAGREVYCVITDAFGNTVTTDVVKLIRVPKEELKLTSPVTDSFAAMGENYCVTVNAQGEGLKYTWYFRNAGSDVWYRSGVTDNTYDDVMTKARANREVYCVITDAFGNTITTEVVTIWLNP